MRANLVEINLMKNLRKPSNHTAKFILLAYKYIMPEILNSDKFECKMIEQAQLTYAHTEVHIQTRPCKINWISSGFQWT